MGPSLPATKFSDKALLSEGDAVSATAELEGVKIIDMSATSETIFVLSHRKEVYELDANSLEVRRN